MKDEFFFHFRFLSLGTQKPSAMVGARTRSHHDELAKERMAASGDKKSEGAKSGVENLPQQTGKSRDAAGTVVSVGGKSIDYATRVLELGMPELVNVVKAIRR